MKSDRGEDSRTSSIRWAKRLLKSADWVVLHTASIGRAKKETIVQIAVLSPKGDIVIDTLVRPPKKQRLSGDELSSLALDREALSNAPKFGSLLADLRCVLEEKRVVSFDASHHKRLFYQTAEHHKCETLKVRWADCVMLKYAKYLGVSADREKGSSSPPTLPREGVSPGAVGGGRAVLVLLKKMASERVPRQTVKEGKAKSSAPKGGRRACVLVLCFMFVIAVLGVVIYFRGLDPVQSMEALWRTAF